MTEAEFTILAPLLSRHLSPRRCAAARMVLVDQATMQTAAQAYGWTRSAVDDAVGRVWSLFQCYRQMRAIADEVERKVPVGYELLTVVAPRTAIQQLRQTIQATLPAARVQSPKSR